MENDSNGLLQKHCCIFYNDVVIARELDCNVDNSMRLIEYVMASSEQLTYPNMTNTKLKQPQRYKHFNNVSRLRQSLETLENTQNKITQWKCDGRNGLKKNVGGNKLNIRNSEPKLSGSLVTSKPSRTKNMSTAKQYTQEKKAYNQRASIKKLQKNKPVSNNLNKKFIEPKTRDNVSDSFISNCKQTDVIRDKTLSNSGTTIRKTSSKENVPLNIYRNILKAAKDSCNVCYKYKASCHCSIDKPIANGSTLKKSKSRRKPMRQVTYVSELDKTVRQKFLHKVPVERKSSSSSSTRSSRTNSIDSKSSKGSLNDLRADSIKKVLAKEKLLKISVNKTVNSPRTSKDILSLKSTPGPNSTLAERKLLFQNNISRRVIHCPLHSKYGNKKYIRALCIEQCPHFSTETSIKSQSSEQINSRSNVNNSTTIKKENNLLKTPRKNITPLTASKSSTSTAKNGQMELKPNTSQTTKKCLSSVKKSSTGATYRSNKTAASYIIGSNSRTLQTKTSADVKTRARSAPTAIPLAKPATATNIRTNSCKKSSFEVSSRGDINKTVLQKRKIRQKSFKLVASRSRSKSLKYKKRPAVNKTIKVKLENENDGDHYIDDDDNDDDRDVRNISNIKKNTSVIDGDSLDTAPHELDSVELSHEREDLDNEIEFADEVIAEYYFELFKSEFPEIVKETNLTKEELVSITPFPPNIFKKFSAFPFENSA